MTHATDIAVERFAAVKLVADRAEEAVPIGGGRHDRPFLARIVTHDLLVATPRSIESHDAAKQFAHIVFHARSE